MAEQKWKGGKMLEVALDTRELKESSLKYN